MKCSRGKARKNGGAKGCGKAAEWKSQKTTFPLRLEIPQTPAGFPLSHSLGDCGTLTTNRTFHLLRKGDTSNVVSRGTFLMSVDTRGNGGLPSTCCSMERTRRRLSPSTWAQKAPHTFCGGPCIWSERKFSFRITSYFTISCRGRFP